MRRFLIFAVVLASLGTLVPARAAQTPAPVASSPLMSLLDLVPDVLSTDVEIRYAHHAPQMAALGLDPATLDADAWAAAMQGVAVPRSLVAPTEPSLREGLGFDARDLDAWTQLGPSDRNILIVTGRFDATNLTTRWEAAGYAPVEGEGATWYTLGEDNFITFDHPLHALHLGSLSHLALLDDGTVVGAATQADLEQVLALHAGEGASLADGRGAGLAAAPHDLVTALIIDGEALIATTDPLVGIRSNPNVPADTQERLATQAAEQADEAPRMPAIELALVGATAGALTPDAAAGTPPARAVAVVVPVEAVDVEMVAETVTRRLTTQTLQFGEEHLGEVYSELFSGMVIESTTEPPAVVIELTPKSDVTATLLIRLQQARQLTFLQWAG